MLVSSVMLSSTFECLYGTFVKIVHEKLYDSLIATPVSAEDAVAGDIAWAAFRGLVSGKYLGELEVDIDGSEVSLAGSRMLPVDKKVHNDPSLLNTLNFLKAGIVADPRFGPVYSQHVAMADRDMEKKWREGDAYRDTAPGNLVADALKDGVKANGFPADIALDANGYLAYKIHKGNVVGNDIMRAVPYGYDPESGLGFKMECVLLAGAQLLAGLEYSVSYVEYTTDLCMEVSGLSFHYDSTKPPTTDPTQLSRLDPASVLINGLSVSPEKVYWIAMSEQLHNFLVSMGITPFDAKKTGLLEYNLVRDYMHKLNHVDYRAEGRVIDTGIK